MARSRRRQHLVRRSGAPRSWRPSRPRMAALLAAARVSGWSGPSSRSRSVGDAPRCASPASSQRPERGRGSSAAVCRLGQRGERLAPSGGSVRRCRTGDDGGVRGTRQPPAAGRTAPGAVHGIGEGPLGGLSPAGWRRRARRRARPAGAPRLMPRVQEGSHRAGTVSSSGPAATSRRACGWRPHRRGVCPARGRPWAGRPGSLASRSSTIRSIGLGQFGPVRAGRLRRGVAVSDEHRPGVAQVERRDAGGDLVQHAAERVEIAAVVDARRRRSARATCSAACPWRCRCR